MAIEQTDKGLTQPGTHKANDKAEIPAPANVTLGNMTEVPKKPLTDPKNADGRASQWTKNNLNKGGTERVSD